MGKLYYQIKLDNNLFYNVGDSRIDFRVYKTTPGGVSNPVSKIELEGGGGASFSPMFDFGSYFAHIPIGIDYAPGTYKISYRDDNTVGTVYVGRVIVLPNSEQCEGNANSGIIISRGSTGLFIAPYTTSGAAIKVTIDEGVTYKNPASNGASVAWYDAELVGVTLIPTIETEFLVGGCFETRGHDFYLGQVAYQPLAIALVKTDVTSNGGSDGTITLIRTGGSGSLTYSWSDGPTTANRSGLIAGTYVITVTDTITLESKFDSINILEPAIVSSGGTFLIVPALNSLTYVIDQAIDQCYNPQALDNVLLCQQQYEGFDSVNYFQRVCKCDVFPTQFYSDFSLFDISLCRYKDNSIFKNFSYELKEQNIGKSENFGITIRNHTGIGQSRVYFNVGVIPLPLKAGDPFEILNNSNGYNGVYSIISILNDVTLGYQYLVINKNFTGGPVETGTGKFISDTADFNVFESSHDFADVPTGQYYMKIRAYGSVVGGIEVTAISEPIDIKTEHEETNLIRYRNADNAFDMTWTTGYLGLLRIPSHFGHKRNPGGERSTSRNSDYSIVKINAKKTRVLTFETFNMPPYLHEKLSCVFDLDSYTINGITCNSSEAYGDPSYKDRFLLASSSIKVEAAWFDKYNSDDIGTVADGGFIKNETGFIKR